MPKRINIKGPIISNDDDWIYELFDIEATSPRMVLKQLNEANGEDVEVYINSGGGYVHVGSEIYTDLKMYSGKVTAKIVGIAASAASVIAMGADHLQIAPTAQMMIHNASGGNWGDHRSMEHAAKILKNTDETIANAYRIKTGMSNEEFLTLMAEETWFTPQQALEKKLVDEILFENQVPTLTASTPVAGMLPDDVINKIRAMKDVLKPAPVDDAFVARTQAKLQLLKLKGGHIDD